MLQSGKSQWLTQEAQYYQFEACKSCFQVILRNNKRIIYVNIANLSAIAWSLDNRKSVMGHGI
jgi:hypothetical protein